MGLTKATKDDINKIKAEIEEEYNAYYNQLYSLYNSIFGYGYTADELKVISENNAKAAVASLSDTYLKEAVMKSKILDAIYADYNTDFDGGLITWVSAESAEEEAVEE